MARFIALFTVILALAGASAFAGGNDNPCNYPGYKHGSCPGDGDQDQGDKPGDGDQGDVPPGHPGHGHPGHGNPGHGHPGHGGLCTGGFEGYYAGNPFPVAFAIQDNGFGQLAVQSWFRGGVFWGQGVCRQVNPFQAHFELYFPGAPIHRGVISRNRFGASIMEGQLDFHGPFQLQRTR